MSSREKILSRIRAAKKPFPSAQSPDKRLAVTPLAADDKELLSTRFIEEAEALSCHVHLAENDLKAAQGILRILAGEKRVLAWAFDQIPCAKL